MKQKTWKKKMMTEMIAKSFWKGFIGGLRNDGF